MAADPTHPPAELVSALRTEGGAILASLRGEIDLHNSPDVRTALLDAVLRGAPKKLILDLGQVPYMDSSAIAVLVELLQKLRKSGGRVFLTSLQPRVKDLLQIVRLDTVFVLAKDEAEAMAK